MTNNVTIFKDANFQGASQQLTAGNYDMNSLQIGNDQLSSLQIPKGMRATIFEHASFTGRSKTFIQDTPWVGDDFNDLASSIVIDTPGEIAADEKGVSTNQILQKINSLSVHYETIQLKDTCRIEAYGKKYNAFVDHCQGVAYANGTYFISHDCSTVPASLLVSVTPGAGKTSFNYIFEGNKDLNHPGGIQACGNILVFPVEPINADDGRTPNQYNDHHVSKISFLDISDPHTPKKLPVEINRSDKKSGAAGIMYSAADKKHYVIIEDDNIDLYRSNGKSLRDPDCSFELVTTFSNLNHSGGGEMLLYETDSQKLYIASLVSESGRQNIYVYEIMNYQSVTPSLSTSLMNKTLGTASDKICGFRFGGTIAVTGNNLEVYSIQRALCSMPGIADYAEVRHYDSRKRVRMVHDAGYVANFVLSWTENGVPKSINYGDKTLGWRETAVLPLNATNLHLRVNGCQFIKIWKTLLDQTINAETGYRITGTITNMAWDTNCGDW